MLKNYLRSFIWSLSFILISTIIITIFNYFNILNGTVLKVIELLIPLVAVFIGSYKLGKTKNEKGYIEGLKYGLLWAVILIIFNIINNSFTLSLVIYLVVFLAVSIFASILGINKRAK